jgi:serine/threonine protein kinase
MSQCLNPECLHKNTENSQVCQHCGANLRLHQQYRAIRIIDRGGFGRTFLAVDEEDGNRGACVIKQFDPQAQGTNNLQKAAQFFSQEIQRLDELGKHPQIPNLLSYFTENNRQYLIQEFINGQDLSQSLKSEGRFSEDGVCNVLQQILPVLDYLHKNRVIHRDVKPENLIRRQDGTLILVDFGAAKHVTTSAISVTGTAIGSAVYASPEQVVGKAKPSSDIYSLGVTCIHLLTQVQPFDLFDIGENNWVWRDYLETPVGEKFGKILDKMLVQATNKRYQSAREVWRDLQAMNDPSSSSFQTRQWSVEEDVRSRLSSATVSDYDSNIDFHSVENYDYKDLENLLAAGSWREADKATAVIMLKVVDREQEGWLREVDIENFPSEDLQTIDELWLQYSNGRFGFSIQKKIYQNLGGSSGEDDEKIWKKFAEVVGWRTNGKWIPYENLYFTQPEKMALSGHLPACLGVGVGGEVLGVFWCSSLLALLSRSDL